MPLLTNPAAAKYGQRREQPVYRAIDRIVRILRPVAEQERVSIALKGVSHNQPAVYDSFDTIPLVLIENAVKYSRKDQTVEVEINDVQRGVRVQVRSFSPHMDDEERRQMFDRGYRADVASKVASRGSGLGLYLAQIVAKAHGFEVIHKADHVDVFVDGVKYCNNTFFFSVGV